MFILSPLISTFLTIICCSIVSASPLEKRTQQYLLQTQVIEGKNDTGTNKNNLYVFSYHTGAGLGDACLTSNITVGEPGNLNGTEWLFQLSEPTPLIVAIDTPNTYTTFWPVHASPADFDGNATTDDFLQVWDGTLQFVFESGERTVGWLACDWWHGIPQLFYLNGQGQDFYYPSYEYPNVCSLVNLNLVPV